MTPEEKALLESTHTLAKENNEILRTINRRGRWSNIVKISYWVIIILISLGAFYFIQPYIDFMRSAIGGSESASTNVSNYAQLLEDLTK